MVGSPVPDAAGSCRTKNSALRWSRKPSDNLSVTGLRAGCLTGLLPTRILPHPCPLVEVPEFAADGVGVGVVEVGEDVQGVGPGGAGGGGVAGSVVGVAEMGEGGGFLVAVAEVPVQVQGVLVAVGGVGVVGEVVVGVADAVPAGGLPGAVAEFLEQGEGLLAGGEGLLVVAEQDV